MIRKFASSNSEDPEITNIQLAFWRMAVKKYREIEQASSLGNTDTNYFFINATTTLILAGSSLTQLVGQNTCAQRGRVPSPKDALKEELGETADLFSEISKFIDFYDDIRHFGEPKHQA